MHISESILSASRKRKTEMPKPNMPNASEPATWDSTSPRQRLVKTARRAKEKGSRKKRRTNCCKTSSRRLCHSLLLQPSRERQCCHRSQQYKGQEVVVEHHVSSLHKVHAIVEKTVSFRMAEARGATRGPRDARVLMVAHLQRSSLNQERHSFASHFSKVVAHHHVKTVACIGCRKEKTSGSSKRSLAKVSHVRMERIAHTRIASSVIRPHQWLGRRKNGLSVVQRVAVT